MVLKEGSLILYTLYYILNTEENRESAGTVYRLVSKTSGGNSMRVRLPPLPPFDPPAGGLRVNPPYFLLPLFKANQRAIRRTRTKVTNTAITREIGGNVLVPNHSCQSSNPHNTACTAPRMYAIYPSLNIARHFSDPSAFAAYLLEISAIPKKISSDITAGTKAKAYPFEILEPRSKFIKQK